MERRLAATERALTRRALEEPLDLARDFPSQLDLPSDLDEARRALAGAISDLSEDEKLVVTLYYYEELAMAEIAQVLGVTSSRVSQLHTQAILRMKHALNG